VTEHDDSKYISTHPQDAEYARRKAVELGDLPVRVDVNCPPGTIYITDPQRLFNDQDDRWEWSVGRIDDVR